MFSVCTQENSRRKLPKKRENELVAHWILNALHLILRAFVFWIFAMTSFHSIHIWIKIMHPEKMFDNAFTFISVTLCFFQFVHFNKFLAFASSFSHSKWIDRTLLYNRFSSLSLSFSFFSRKWLLHFISCCERILNGKWSLPQPV